MDYQEAIRDIQFLSRRYDDLPNVNYSISRESLDIAISTMNELRLYKEGKLCLVPESVYSKQCEELDEYKALGTLEEVRAAVYKQNAIKIIKAYDSDINLHWCSCGNCAKGLGWETNLKSKYCPECGQKLDWSEEK